MPRDIFRLGYSVKMQAEESDTAEIMLYGQIVEDGPKWWKWSEEDKSAADFDKAVKEVRKSGATKLLLRINSPGGVCTESVAMRSILATAGFDEINIRIEGMCASAATDIATLPGAHVAIAEGSEYMIHNPWCMAVGNANEMEKTIERLRNIEEMSRGFYVKRTGQDADTVKKWMDEEKWFTAEQAVEYGFADEVLRAETGDADLPAVACVTGRVLNTMREMYRNVPEEMAARDEAEETAENTVSNDAPVAGASSEITYQEEGDKTMDVKDITMEQLLAENPALIAQIEQNALAADRERRADIDALTLPGYEAMAEEAKTNGTSAMDFQKQVVQAQKQKGAAYLASRETETKPAQNVGASAAEDKADPDAEMDASAREVAMYATQYKNRSDNGMF